MRQPTYTKRFKNDANATAWSRTKNRANRMPGWVFVVVDGPDGDYAVVDIRTAQDMGALYSWAA